MNEKREIRLIGLDLDGTLLDKNKILPQETKALLESCLAQGIEVLPATGRTKSAIPDYLKAIKGIRYILTSNGAAVVDLLEDSVLYENCIPCERGLEILEILESYGTFYDAYIDGQGYCEARFYDHTDEYRIEPKIQELIHFSRKRIEGSLYELVKTMGKPIEKINMFFKDPDYRLKVYEELEKIPDIKVTCSLVNNLEINGATCNKGDALLGLGRILSIPREQIMACGDGNNDLEMVSMAGFGVAMENGEEEVKKAADFITVDNNHQGVAYAIKNFVKMKDI